MADVVFVAVIVALVALAALLVRACERIIGRTSEAAVPAAPRAANGSWRRDAVGQGRCPRARRPVERTIYRMGRIDPEASSLLLPMSIVFTLVLVSEGATQNLHATRTVSHRRRGQPGIYNATSAHPFENPNPFTDILQIWLLLAIPFALPLTFGNMAEGRRTRGRRRRASVRGPRRPWALKVDSTALGFERPEILTPPQVDNRRRETRAASPSQRPVTLRQSATTPEGP